MYEFGLRTENKVYGEALSLGWLKHGLGCVWGIFPSVAIFEANNCVWKTVWSIRIVIMSLSGYGYKEWLGEL